MIRHTLLAAVMLAGVSVYGQKAMHGHSYTPVIVAGSNTLPLPAAKTTSTGDTLILSNIPTSDSSRLLYSHTGTGSGYVTGTNSYGDMGFAERFDFNDFDSSIQVLGVYAQFGGTVNPSSTHSAVLKIWNSAPPSMISGTLYYNGFPADMVDSVSVPFTQLGIGPVKDTLKQFMFATPTSYLSGAFYAGYTIAYNYNVLDGDTIGIATTQKGHRATDDYKINYITDADGDTTLVDTVLNVQNATQWTDGLWYDNYSQNDSIANNLAIFPIVVIGTPLGVGNITRNNLTFYGSYPNPANSVLNITYSLTTPQSVTIDVLDINGQHVSSVNEPMQQAGTHTIPLSTTKLAAGNYFYIIHTAGGDGIASQFTITR